MAVNPKVLMNTLLEDEKRRADELEVYLDNKLTRDYSGGSKTNVWVSKGYISPRVQNELRKRYQQSGWSDVKFETSSDPREAGATNVIFYV